jgi:hypothetical protein
MSYSHQSYQRTPTNTPSTAPIQSFSKTLIYASLLWFRVSKQTSEAAAKDFKQAAGKGNVTLSV